MTAALLALPFGIAVGMSLGLVGAGGSLLTVPVLVFVLDQTAQAATTASLLIVGVTAVAGVLGHSRRGTVRWRVALAFGGAAAVGAIGGTALNRLVGSEAILLAFGFLMVVAAVLLVRQRPTGERAGGRLSLTVALVGLGVGALTGFFGVGGGFVIVPALVLAVGLPIEAAVGTSLAVIAIGCAAALTGHLTTGEIDWAVTGSFAAAAVVGVLVGARLGGRIPPVALARTFALVVGLLGLFLVIRGLLTML